jgi:hypothetical protein
MPKYNLRDTFGPHPAPAKGDRGSGVYSRNYVGPTTSPPRQRGPENLEKLVGSKSNEKLGPLPKVGAGGIYRQGGAGRVKRYTAP